MRDLTTWLAIWGAITGTAGVALAGWALIWQIRTRHEAPHANLRVELSVMADKHYLFGGGVTDAVLIHVTNRSPLPVRVVAAGILPQKQDQPDYTFRPISTPGAADLPKDVEPRKGIGILFEFDAVRKVIALSKPAVAWVRTDTGQRFLSQRTQVIRPGTNGYADNLLPTLKGYG